MCKVFGPLYDLHGNRVWQGETEPSGSPGRDSSDADRIHAVRLLSLLRDDNQAARGWVTALLLRQALQLF